MPAGEIPVRLRGGISPQLRLTFGTRMEHALDRKVDR